MELGPRRTKPECTGSDAFLDDLGHLYQVIGGGFFVPRAAITHHVSTNRTVGNMGRDIHHPGHLI